MDAEVPDEVVNAARLNFSIGVTAYLYHPEVYGFSLTGRVYFDHKERFPNGRMIRTSDVIEFVEIADYVVAITLTGSAYVLIAPGCSLLALPGG
ncbi:hypothetical protein ALQ72_01901 [Pseudomonas syringae pv. maculicola]|uniref:hypothetical protein n=1 Tax=Pseudomonas syringae group genomosp. 3 TaxID=251701 RepID=UPI0006B8AFF6|nr:hypothetical protein [Pseudomonas syringae group genomosp. 3]MBM0210372.1 hypothetical protein [Pseudomonas syringae pv. maculicola]RMM77608.1 hypothetical protein ALQ72_01901 [Pseudomonas syringae pv. maculicola]